MLRKQMMTVTLAVVGIITLGGTVSAQNSNSTSGSEMNSNMNSNSNMSGQKAMMLSSMDKKFMMEAAAGGMAEVELAKLALDKSANDDVKKYAQQMIDDHTKAGDELKEVATMKNVMLPTGPDAKHMALMAKMRSLSSAEFDKMYIKEAGVNDHAKMEKLFMKESTGGKDADTRGFASKTLPTVQMHLKMARDMSSMMMSGTMKSKM